MATSDITYGVKLIASEGWYVHTYDTWGCWMSAPPSYSSRKRKENIVSIPFSDSVLDFSRLDGRSYYEESEVTYTISYKASGQTFSARVSDMREKQYNIESYLWGFHGPISDDYMSGKTMANARCVSLEFEPNLAAGVLTATFTMRGEYFS